MGACAQMCTCGNQNIRVGVFGYALHCGCITQGLSLSLRYTDLGV